MASLCKTPCQGNVHMLHFDLPYVDAKSVTVSGSENVMLPFSCPLIRSLDLAVYIKHLAEWVATL